MKRISGWLRRIAAGEGGQDMVEYAMVSTFISVAIVLAALIANVPGAFGVWATDVASCVADVATC